MSCGARRVSARIRCNSEIASAVWTGRDWTLTTKAGETINADILISAVGRLHHPSMPDIKGLESFQGQAFHSARWPKGLTVDGKRIGIIGTGSSATQMTAGWDPGLAERMFATWAERGLISDELMDVTHLIETVDGVIRLGVSATIPLVAVTPRRPL